jgi:Holliday junction resolvase
VSVPPAISDVIRAGKRAKRRGKVGEAEIVTILKAFGWKSARRNLEQPQYARDILGGPGGIRLSVKRTERLRLREAFDECEVYARLASEIPVVAHRANGQPWLATIELEELLPLLALRERG